MITYRKRSVYLSDKIWSSVRTLSKLMNIPASQLIRVITEIVISYLLAFYSEEIDNIEKKQE